MHHLSLISDQQDPAPFYLYDEQVILANIDRFRSVPYSPTRIHFATMANDNPVLLSALRDHGIGVFVNSKKHLILCLDIGFTPQQILFAATGVSASMMQLLITHGIQTNVDSPEQLRLYGRLNPGGSVGVRLNIEEKSKNNVFNGNESRIGVLASELPDLLDIANQYQLRLNGVHVYLGTDVTDLTDLMQGIDKTIEMSRMFPDLEFVDFGGGFPIRAETFDFDAYKTAVADRMHALSRSRGRDIQLIIEPGRAMFGNAARFYIMVTDIKERPDRYILFVNASASLIPRAMFYEDYNPVRTLKPCEPFDKPVDVTGNTTYSRDFLARGITLDKVAIGDWIALEDAGSYCYSMITRFLGQDMPAEYLRRIDGQHELIRAPDTDDHKGLV